VEEKATEPMVSFYTTEIYRFCRGRTFLPQAHQAFKLMMSRRLLEGQEGNPSSSAFTPSHLHAKRAGRASPPHGGSQADEIIASSHGARLFSIQEEAGRADILASKGGLIRRSSKTGSRELLKRATTSSTLRQSCATLETSGQRIITKTQFGR